jgi:histidyl-tRNA synthetase
MVGETELAQGTIALKDMVQGSQQSLTIEQVVELLK